MQLSEPVEARLDVAAVTAAMKRKKIGTQAELAQILGLSPATVTRAFRGDRPPIEFLAGLQERVGLRMDRAVIIGSRNAGMSA